MALSAKVFAVTGGASGIGLATAKILSGKGATVCIADISETALKEASSYFTSNSLPFTATQVDVSNRLQVDNWINSIVDKFGRLDGAANVAGVIGKDHGKKPVKELDDGEWNMIMAVNLTGCMFCMRAQLGKMAPGGSIVNVASIHGTRAMPNYGAYAASKWGVIGLTQVAAKENGAAAIRVNAVAPGSVHTPMMQKWLQDNGQPMDSEFDASSALQRQGKPEEIANVIVFLLGPESSFVSGACYSVDGAWL